MRLTPTERSDHLAKQLCFVCHKPGHMARNCPERRTQPGRPMYRPQFRKPLPTTGKEMYKHVRMLMQDLPDEERAEAVSEMEKEGF